ncbi:MAG: hypothetical protein IKP51_01125 [Treponema sp.]|nr:hypothetical protein [Treponema sp.]
MERIFSKERIILGLMGISILIFFWLTIFKLELSFDAASIMLFLLFAIGFGTCINLITAHTAYTSTNLFIWAFFHRKKIALDKITQIYRTWQGSGKNLRLRWYVLYLNKNKESKARLYLPEDYNSEKITKLINTIKTVNEKFIFVLGIGKEY